MAKAVSETCNHSHYRSCEDETVKERTGEVRVQVPVPVGTFLLNEKRQQLESIQRRHKVRVLVIPNPNMETPTYDLQRLRDDDPQVANLELSIDVQASTPAPEPELVRAKQAEAREQALVTDIKPKTPAPESAPEPLMTEENSRDDSIGLKKRPESARRRQNKRQQKSLLSRVLGFLFGDAEDEQTQRQTNPKDRRRNNRTNERRDRTDGNQKQRPQNNRGAQTQETERTLDGSQGGRRRRRRRSKNRSENPELMETEIQTTQEQEISPERETELKAHEENLTPRPKRAERKQRGENAIANQEAQLEAHATTSGEITIDDAPVLNEGLMSESERPKRARRGRRGSRRTNEVNSATETPAVETPTEVTEPAGEAKVSETEATAEAATSDVPQEGKPQRARRGRGRPRKTEIAANEDSPESSAAVEDPAEVKPESAPVTEANDDAEKPKKKPAHRGRKPKPEADDAPTEVIVEEPAQPEAEEPAAEKAADVAVDEGSDKPKRGRGRGGRRAPEAVTESFTAPSVSDLKAQLLDDGVDAGTTATAEDAEKPKRGRGRGRPRKADTQAQTPDSVPQETTETE
jgi:ribonuclease E